MHVTAAAEEKTHQSVHLCGRGLTELYVSVSPPYTIQMLRNPTSSLQRSFGDLALYQRIDEGAVTVSTLQLSLNILHCMGMLWVDTWVVKDESQEPTNLMFYEFWNLNRGAAT